MPGVERVKDLPLLPPRARDAHKGSFGTVIVIAGSEGMSGAAILCGSGALRGGAGLVRVAVPKAIQAIVASGNPCYMTVEMPWVRAGKFAQQDLGKILNLVDSAD
ncbi:MAG TPA: NAD(P)H-hydrate dehydratase, partial [Gemmataceae bacterium]|nr:NAD(P)H-hydrate dehydratase [Gemmataceae bacterium]